MRIKIGARKSDLARLQAYRVGDAIASKFSGVEVEYLFSTSLGDQNQHDPLWKMPEKGVFTEDLTKKLVAGECDLVVHSWKDLPVESRPETSIAATLPRADARDVILFRREAVDAAPAPAPAVLRVFSSSPRRGLSVGEFLKWALPFECEVKFENVRGNILTRVRKLMGGEADGLVVAKAAIDRLLSSTEDEFASVRDELRGYMDRCRWMIAPLSVNPGAPAQGALAIEIANGRSDLREILAAVNCADTFVCVEKEREVLRSYGGGCHQKIGMTCIKGPWGEIEFHRGETDSGARIDRSLLLAGVESGVEVASRRAKVAREKLFPLRPDGESFFRRERLNVSMTALKERDLWVAKEMALPKGFSASSGRIVWTSGVSTWRKLAKRGVWVSGTQDSLGEDYGVGCASLLGREPDFLKLSHQGAEGLSGKDFLATYKLVERAERPDLQGKTHFYWTSYSQFASAVRDFPEIRAAQHACGLGHTYNLIRKDLGPDGQVELFLSHENWLRSYGAGDETEDDREAGVEN